MTPECRICGNKTTNPYEVEDPNLFITKRAPLCRTCFEEYYRNNNDYILKKIKEKLTRK